MKLTNTLCVLIPVLISSVSSIVFQKKPSTPSYEKFNFKLTNDLDSCVYLYWIDFHSGTNFYSTLEAGSSVYQESYLYHRWFVADGYGYEREFEMGIKPFDVSGLSINLSELDDKISNRPVIEWSVFDSQTNKNPVYEKTYLREIDCSKSPNVIYLDAVNIGFQKYYELDFVDKDIASNFEQNLYALRCDCHDFKVAFDSHFQFTNEINEILEERDISIQRIIDSIVVFVLKYQADGFVIHFGEFVPVDNSTSKLFFSELSKEFKRNELELIGRFQTSSGNFDYIDPLIFEYLDYIQLQLTDWNINEPEFLTSHVSLYRENDNDDTYIENDRDSINNTTIDDNEFNNGTVVDNTTNNATIDDEEFNNGTIIENIFNNITSINSTLDMNEFDNSTFDDNNFENTTLKGLAKQNNMISVIRKFIDLGAPKEKLSIEISSFGISYKYFNETDIGSPADGYGYYPYDKTFLLLKNTYSTINQQIYDYKTICEIQRDLGWTKEFDNTQKVAYAFNDHLWLSYNNFESIEHKINLVKELEIAGVWIDAINLDDIYGSCDGTTYPVTTYTHSILSN